MLGHNEESTKAAQEIWQNKEILGVNEQTDAGGSGARKVGNQVFSQKYTHPIGRCGRDFRNEISPPAIKFNVKGLRKWAIATPLMHAVQRCEKVNARRVTIESK